MRSLSYYSSFWRRYHFFFFPFDIGVYGNHTWELTCSDFLVIRVRIEFAAAEKWSTADNSSSFLGRMTVAASKQLNRWERSRNVSLKATALYSLCSFKIKSAQELSVELLGTNESSESIFTQRLTDLRNGRTLNKGRIQRTVSCLSTISCVYDGPQIEQ